MERYVSEVGNNDVPYPYAVDQVGNYYLMIENTVLLSGRFAHLDNQEPYIAFYDHQSVQIRQPNGRRKTVQYYPDLQWHMKYAKVPKEQYLENQRQARQALGVRFLPHKKVLQKRFG